MIIDLETLFPDGLSNETVSAISDLLYEIAHQWESTYFHRIHRYQAQQQVDLFGPEQPWKKHPVGR